MIKKGTKIYIGMATCGLAAGGQEVYDSFVSKLGKKESNVQLIPTGCIGVCSREVIVDVEVPGMNRVTYEKVKPEMVEKIISEHLEKDQPVNEWVFGQSGDKKVYPGIEMYQDLPMFKNQVRIVLRNCGSIDPDKIEDYINAGGYKAIKKALKMGQSAVIAEITKAGLRGRGGAGFPTGKKWDIALQQKSGQKYFICNADEGDPGAFMNRSTLEGDPHAVIEGLIIGGYAIGASKGYIYCRAEYPLAVKRLHLALEQAREKGFLGKKILGSDFDFDITVKEGAGAFVCGEETALIASIEGERGMPRPRPPYPAQSGLWGKPTNINNVETLANIPYIINEGGEKFASFGTEKSKGTKVFAITGKIKNTGLVEVPMGITINDMIYKVAGGMATKKKFKAIQVGGPSGGCVTAALGDTKIDYESLVSVGAIMGSGGAVVLDEGNCMVDTARFFLEFTKSESCGKCAPCRLGISQMLSILNRICEGKGKPEDKVALVQIAETVKGASLCGLGQTSPNPVITTLRYFEKEYDEHINEKKCKAGICAELLRFEVDETICKKCGICVKQCPAQAIQGGAKTLAKIDKSKCTKCRKCIEACPFCAIY
ncbi:MAG: NADH-quinone oxidoreductase subunit NuoF [bacterium]|nr:NADH-quinone oxidoreductase subunit NuoF [bacterium]